MTDKKRSSRDIWKQAPGGSEGDAAKDYEGAEAQHEGSEESVEPHDYEPRHRAPGRAPLIRRRRSKAGDEETVAWETSWSEGPPPPRWTDEEEPSIMPPPRPIEDVPSLGRRRTEHKKKRARPAGEPVEPEQPRSRDYTGRHLAPKKPRWSKGPESEAERAVDHPTGADPALVEGDVEDPRDEEIVDPQPPSEAADESTEDTAVAPDEAGDEVQPDETRDEVQADEAAAPPASRETEPPVAHAPETGAATPAPDVSADTGARGPSDADDDTADEGRFDIPSPQPGGPEGAFVASDEEPDAALLEAAEDETDAGLEPDEEPLDFDEEDPDLPPGPRRAALEKRKKKKRALQAALVAAAVVAAGAGVVGAGLLVKEAVEGPQQRAVVPVDDPRQEEEIGGTTLFFGTKEEGDPSRGAIWMTLLTVDPETEEGSIVYLPAHTAVEVPGRGLQGVGESYGSGGIPLLLVSAENLLGIAIDRYVELSDKDARVLFEQFETLTVNVPAEVRVSAGRDRARLVFVEGPQEMTPSLLVDLLYTIGLDGDDVELGSRHLAFWDQLLEVYDDPSELADAFESAGAALGESDASAEVLASFMGSLAELRSEDVTITALPVRPISVGDSQLYSTNAEELTAFIDDTIGTRNTSEQEIRVQLLNGNGVPGIGREAAAKLVGEGFRVILGGNARRLDYRKTLVIAYDSSDRGIALAERARELLGVGEVQVSAQEQGIVDLTIVVGKDFLRAR